MIKTYFRCLETTSARSTSSQGTDEPATTGSSRIPGTTGAVTTQEAHSSSASPSKKTTPKFCDEMQFINTIVNTNSLKTLPKDIVNKQDIITTGVDFIATKPSILITVPNNGAIIRDIDVFSSNVAEIEVVFVTQSGNQLAPIKGVPTELATDEFPTEKVREITVTLTKTKDAQSPQDVTMSVIACAEATTATVRPGTV